MGHSYLLYLFKLADQKLKPEVRFFLLLIIFNDFSSLFDDVQVRIPNVVGRGPLFSQEAGRGELFSLFLRAVFTIRHWDQYIFIEFTFYQFLSHHFLQLILGEVIEIVLLLLLAVRTLILISKFFPQPLILDIVFLEDVVELTLLELCLKPDQLSVSRYFSNKLDKGKSTRRKARFNACSISSLIFDYTGANIVKHLKRLNHKKDCHFLSGLKTRERRSFRSY